MDATTGNVLDQVESLLPGLDADARKEAVGFLRRVVLENMYDMACASDSEGPECCPRCGGMDFHRKGRDRDGAQRWFCRDCSRSFGAKTNKVVGMSKLGVDKWIAYAECFADRLSVRASSEKCGVSVPTSFFMRHRLLECLARFCPAFGLEAGERAELDEKFFAESFKGNHAKDGFDMPRPSRKRGKQVRKRGLSKEQLCVMTGVNESGHVFLELAGRGSLGTERALSVLRGKVADGAIVATDQAGAYVGALRELKVAVHERYSSKDRSRGTINKVNAVHSSLEHFMEPFKGVATKHLMSYLMWYKWRLVFGRQGAGAGACAISQADRGLYHTRRRELADRPSPYMDYWAQTA